MKQKLFISFLYILCSYAIFKPGILSAQPKLLAPGVINSINPEFGGSVSRKGNEFYFNRTDSSRAHIQLLYSEYVNNTWQIPKPVSFSDTSFRDVDPFITSDGRTLYFSSDRKHPNLYPGYNSWKSKKINNIWQQPVPLDTILNSSFDEVYCSLTKKGSIYFTRFEGSRSVIYSSTFKKGHFSVPVRLNIPIHDTIRISNPAIAPDESFILFMSGQLGTRNPDLYVSTRLSKKEWSIPKNLGPQVNSSGVEFAPFISPDGKWLYFTSERPGVVQDYPKGLRRPGDIYRIRLKGLL